MSLFDSLRLANVFRYLGSKLVICFLIITSLNCWSANDRLMQEIPNDVTAPIYSLFDGKQLVDLTAFRGSYVLVNFWATWCRPCVNEMPSLDKLALQLEEKGLVFVAVSQDKGGVSQVRPFLERLALKKTTVLYDVKNRSFRDYALRGLPTTVLISPEGVLMARLEGDAVWDEGALASQIARLITIKKGH